MKRIMVIISLLLISLAGNAQKLTIKELISLLEMSKSNCEDFLVEKGYQLVVGHENMYVFKTKEDEGYVVNFVKNSINYQALFADYANFKEELINGGFNATVQDNGITVYNKDGIVIIIDKRIHEPGSGMKPCSLVFLSNQKEKKADNIELLKYKAFEATIFSKELQINSGWEPTDILVLFQFKDSSLNKISVYAKKVTKYVITSFVKTYVDENDISWFIYNGVNEAGEDFTIEWAQINNPNKKHVGTLKMHNSKGLGFIYRLKIEQ